MQEPPLHGEMEDRRLRRRRRGGAEDLELPAEPVEGGDDGSVAPAAEGETRRRPVPAPERLGDRVRIGRVAHHVDIAAGKIDPEWRRSDDGRAERCQREAEAAAGQRVAPPRLEAGGKL